MSLPPILFQSMYTDYIHVTVFPCKHHRLFIVIPPPGGKIIRYHAFAERAVVNVVVNSSIRQFACRHIHNRMLIDGNHFTQACKYTSICMSFEVQGVGARYMYFLCGQKEWLCISKREVHNYVERYRDPYARDRHREG